MREDCVLLTGGAGFIGSHVVERLLAAGKTVVNLDLLTYAGNLANLTAVESHPGYRFVHGDLGDRGLVAKLLEEFQPGVVFNIAAESHVDRSIDDASAFLHTNVTAVHAILDTCLAYWRGLPAGEKQRFRFIQMSTDEVYGSIAEGVFTEESNFEPNSPYAASKAAGDHFVRAFRVTFGLPTLIVHASNTYGPRQFPEKLIPHMVLSATAGKQLPVYGQGTNVRDWMYVEDLAEGLLATVQQGKPGEVYNFAGGNEWKNIDTVHAICAVLDAAHDNSKRHADLIHYVTDRPGHDLRYAMSADKVAACFGWRPATSFEAGLKKTVHWYLQNRAWIDTVLQRGYATQRIGTR